MKKILYVVPLWALAVSCQKNDPTTELASDEFVVKTVGLSSDCGVPMIQVVDQPDRVAQLVGAKGPVYTTYGLAAEPGLPAGRLLVVRVRKSVPGEAIICKAYGPGYPQLTVVSARVQ